MSLLRKSVTGLTIPQQYVCVPLEDFQQPLRVFLTLSKKDFFVEVTSNHLFLGYKPLVIAILPQTDEHILKAIREEDFICLNFLEDNFQPNLLWHNFHSAKSCIGRIILKKTKEREVGGQNVSFYEGQYGAHTFLNPFHQFVNRQRERIRKPIPGNVQLIGNLYDQVRIAYSVPRIIPLITITDGHKINMFPTDLHGPAGKNFYFSSLRIGGKANAK